MSLPLLKISHRFPLAPENKISIITWVLRLDFNRHYFWGMGSGHECGIHFAYKTSEWWGLGLLKLYFLSKGIQSQLNIKPSKLEICQRRGKAIWLSLHSGHICIILPICRFMKMSSSLLPQSLRIDHSLCLECFPPSFYLINDFLPYIYYLEITSSWESVPFVLPT